MTLKCQLEQEATQQSILEKRRGAEERANENRMKRKTENVFNGCERGTATMTHNYYYFDSNGGGGGVNGHAVQL